MSSPSCSFEDSNADYDEETVSVSVFQDEPEKENDEQSHPKTTTCDWWKRALAGVFLVFLIVLAVLYRDIKQTANRMEESPESLLVLDQVLVNVRPSSPVVTADLQVKASPRFSKIRLQDVSCRMSSGSFHVQADYQSNEEYSLTLTCPPEDVDGHAAFLRQGLTAEQVPMNIQCDIRLRVWLANILPVRKTVSFDYQSQSSNVMAAEEDASIQSGNDNGFSQHGEAGESSHESPDFPVLLDANSGRPVEGPSSSKPDEVSLESSQSHSFSPGLLLMLLDANSGKPVEGPSGGSTPSDQYMEDENDPEITPAKSIGAKNDSENAPALSIGVESWGPDILSLRATWSLMPAPTFVKSLKVLLPSLQVTVRPDYQDEDLVVTWDAFEATIFSSEHSQSEELLNIEIACMNTKEACPWFNPVYKTLFSTNNRPTKVGDTTFHKVVILVDAADSFLENVIGEVQYWTVQNYMDTPSSALASGFASRRRLASTNELLTDLAELTSECLRIAPDDDIAVEVAFCLGVDASSSDEGSVVSVCNMTFFETALIGMGIGEWIFDSSETDDTFQLLTTVILVEPDTVDAAGTTRVDIGGNFTIRLSDLDAENDIEILWKMDNLGDWIPFETQFSMNGISSDDVLKMTLIDTTVSLDGTQHLEQAQGVVLVDAETRSFQLSVSDAAWNIQGMAQIEGNVPQQVEDPYAPNGGTETANVNFFRGNSTVQRNNDVLWDTTWEAKVWNMYYYDLFGAFETERDHYFLEVELTELVEDITASIGFDIVDFTSQTVPDYQVMESYIDEYLRYFKVQAGGTQHMDSSGTVTIDYEKAAMNVSASDPVLDFVADVNLLWFSESAESNDNRLYSNSFEVTDFAETSIYFGIEEGDIGVISDDGAKASLNIQSLPTARFKVDGKLGYEWTEAIDTFSVTVDDLQMDFNADALLDVSGNIVLNFEKETIEVVLVDDNVQDFNVDMDMSWYWNSDDDWGFLAEKIFWEHDSIVSVDNSVSFRLQPPQPSGTEIFVEDDGNPVGVLQARSLSEATMQLDMDMNFTFIEDSSFFQMIMDTCHLEYDDTVYLDIGRAVSAPASTPSSAPTDPPTLLPSTLADVATQTPRSKQTFEFSGIVLEVSVAIELSFQNIQNLQEALEQFYELIYTDSSSRRNLQAAGVTEFQTDVRITSADVTTEGNTVTYDQTVSFVPSDGGTVSGADARDLLISPFQDDVKKQEFLTILKESDSAFASVESIDSPVVPLPDNAETPKEDDDSSSALLYGLIGGGVLLCCCCAGFSYLFVKRRGDTTRSVPEEGIATDKFYDEEQTGGGYNPSALTSIEETPPSNFQANDFDKGESEEGEDDNESTSEDENSSGSYDDDGESSGEDSNEDDSSSSDDSDGEFI